MHGLRRELLERQAKAIDMPLTTIELPEEPSMEEYSSLMQQTVKKLQAEGYTYSAFGDIFLEDLRSYRELQLAPLNIACVFPLWKRNTKEIMREFIELGFKAIVICIKSDVLDVSFLGREIDNEFLNDLPSDVDPCGENGEFHTFCFDGPIFKTPVKFELGEKVFREYKKPNNDTSEETKSCMGFWFIDLLPVI